MFSTVSCSHEDIEKNIDKSDKYFISLEKARNIAEKLNLENPYTPKNTQLNLRVSDNRIKEETTINGIKNPAYYIFNYEDNAGFSVISADFRAMPILAYSSNGNFTNLNDTINSGLATYLQEYFDYIVSVRDTVKTIPIEIASMWNTAAAKAIGPIDPCDIEPDLPCNNDDPFVSTTQTWGPLLQTEWNQGTGYNDQIDIINGCRPPTGCVATAMAQIMRYWQHPSSFNWSALPVGDFPNNEIALLMRACGDAVDMNWTCRSSGANSNDAKKAFKNDFGYSNDIKYKDYLYYQARNDIKTGRPVYLRGCRTRTKKGFIIHWYVYDGCHAWIADGIRITNFETYSAYQVHMNWGWGQDGGNGWYVSWNNGSNYQYDRRMIYKIHP